MNVESICVRNVRLEAVGNKAKLAQGESDRILLAVPREMWPIVRWHRGLGIQDLSRPVI